MLNQIIAQIAAVYASFRNAHSSTKAPVRQDALDTAISSMIAVLEGFTQCEGIPAILAAWKGYQALTFSQKEYKVGWGPYNGHTSGRVTNLLPPQMSLKNARAMSDIALISQVTVCFRDGAGWGRLSRVTSFTGFRTDSRKSDSENESRLRMGLSNKALCDAMLQEALKPVVTPPIRRRGGTRTKQVAPPTVQADEGLNLDGADV